jgi:AMP deaminase
MSSRDLASLRTAAGSPPPPGRDGEDERDAASEPYNFHEPPTPSAFALNKEAAVNFRDITAGDTYRRVVIEPGDLSPPEQVTLAKLRAAILLREKWVYAPRVAEWKTCPVLPHQLNTDRKEVTPAPPYDPFDPVLPDRMDASVQWEWRDGVVCVSGLGKEYADQEGLTYADFAVDMEKVMAIANDPEVRTWTWRRLKLNTERYSLYSLLNGEEESLAQKRFPHRDFYNVVKVDGHVHATSMATQKHFLSYIKSKLKRCGDDVVLPNRDDLNGPPLTLRQTFESLNMRAEDLSVDTLDVHHSSGQNLFQRFDRFNTKYNPLGASRLREVFLKTDNLQGGQYFAELTKQVMADQELLKYQLAEYRISIYGKSPSEWRRLADWFYEHRIFSNGTRWLVQIPRLYSSYAESGLVRSFGEMLHNIFNPIFQATLDPASHPRIFALLQSQMVGIDSVDDESLPPPRGKLRDCPPPDEWTSTDNPPYAYYSYYIQANLRKLNRLREARRLNTLAYRPHCGEAGPLDHLGTAFLLANSINHGIKLKSTPVLQYLFLVTQIGLSMSPISNSALFLEYAKNPAHEFFLRGLNVALSTDDPLQFAMTREPLLEELSVFAAVNRCSNTDLCELARNSVLQSGFEACIKRRWLGPKWYLAGHSGNDPRKTNIPSMRLKYRYDTLVEEINLLWENAIDQEEPSRLRSLPTWSEVSTKK